VSLTCSFNHFLPNYRHIISNLCICILDAFSMHSRCNSWLHRQHSWFYPYIRFTSETKDNAIWPISQHVNEETSKSVFNDVDLQPSVIHWRIDMEVLFRLLLNTNAPWLLQWSGKLCINFCWSALLIVLICFCFCFLNL
jgi:hypothetical protein